MHDDAMSSHLACMRTYLKTSRNYYWPNMRSEIKAYCEKCVV